MKINYLTKLAVASVMTIAVVSGCANPEAQTPATSPDSSEVKNPCASKDNPCASKANPCASKDNPCASKTNPCASKDNPCASKANPCASKDNPCASKSNPCAAKDSNQSQIFSENGVAIRGTDPVAYFTEGQAVAGSSQHSYQWQGATWYFASVENRDRFATNPEEFAPQYGGFCAWAVSQGYTAPIDPEAWKIVDGKLYLNYSKGVQQRWSRDIPGNIAKADRNWPGVLAKQ